jgi:glycosyltransferase involved in cell wall biosynthesis
MTPGTIMAKVDSMALVSILVPAYNAERWIRQCLDSALEQTYAATEVIVVDDGSTDGTVEVVRKYEGRVRLVKGAHEGGNVARNQLVALASGEWLQFLDADDYLLPEKIANQMRCVDDISAHDVLYSPVLLLNDLDGSQRILQMEESDDVTLHFLRWGVLNTNGFLFKRQAVLDVGGWNAGQAACQEHELLYRLIRADKKCKLVNSPGAVYRFHGSTTVSRKDPLRTLRLKLELLDKMQNHLEQHDLLTRRHRKELYAGRIEAARGAWRIDPEFACALAASARRTGTWWVSFSPGLPATFQFALRFLGFAGAERLAGVMRNVRQILS